MLIVFIKNSNSGGGSRTHTVFLVMSQAQH